MIPALSALLVLTAQVPTTVRPAGASQEFNETLTFIQQAVKANDYAKAERLLGLMPKDRIVYKWDDSKVPAALRPDFERQRDAAIKTWSGYFSWLEIAEGPKPDVVFSFEPELAANSETGVPLGLATFYSADPSKPRYEAVIGLKRGKQKKATTPGEVGNEVRYVIGKMLGLATAPVYGPATSRTDQSTNSRTVVTNQESGNASQIRNYVFTLRQALQKKESIPIYNPKAYTDTKDIDLGTVAQGQVIGISVQLTNNGDGPLSYSILPDCGCISTTPSGTIEAGTTKLLKADFDSSQFTGEVHKRLMIYTNDPDKTSFVIPVKAQIRPAYRFVRPEGDIIVASGRQAKADVYLLLPEGSDIKPTDFRLDGMKSTVKGEPWAGTLTDPESNQKVTGKGFKVSMEIDDSMPMGRAGLTLTVGTDSPTFPELVYNLYIQKGIVILPQRVYLGELSAAKEDSFVVSRPGKPFKITSVNSSSPNLSAKVEPMEEQGDYLVTVRYDGKGKKGDLAEKLTVKTDDPSQPVLEVSVSGRVR